MTVRVNKQPFNIREKLSELERPIGVKGQELMRAETAQDARDLVSAGRKNLIINGDMRIAQRGTSANVPNSGAIGTVDRWYSWINYNSGVVLMSQENDSPPGFHKSLKLARNDSSSPAQYLFVGQKIEAQNLSQLEIGTSSAKPFTISFWVKSNRPGTYNLEAIDDDGSHQLVKQYKINNSGVWEHKSITFPPNTAGGVPTYDNTVGLELAWWLSSNANTTYTSGSLTDSWAAFATNRRNVGGNSILDTGQYWMISGVQLEVGSNATNFEYRSYGEELALCQRYYERYQGDDSNGGYATFMMASKHSNTVIVAQPIFRVPKVAPAATFSYSGSMRMYNYSTGSAVTITGVNNAQLGTHGGYIVLTTSSFSIPNGDAYRLEGDGDSGAYIAFQSEL